MERIFYYGESPLAADQEKEKILRQAVELEKELMKMKRAEKVLQEMEQRYLCLMDSAVFLYIILSLGGTFRMMNRRAEEFFGFQLRPGTDVTLQSLAGPGYTKEVEIMLRDSRKRPLHASFPARCADGAVGWLDMELFISVYRGEDCVQAIASDITALAKGMTPGARPSSPTPLSGFRASRKPEPEDESKSRPAERARDGSQGFPPELLNSVPEPFFIADGQGNCVEPNACFLKTLKLSRDKIAGRPFADLALQGDPLNERFSEKFAQFLRGSFTEALECRICAGDGEVFLLSLRGTRLEGGATVVACADLTKLRRAEEQLKRVSTVDVSTGTLNRQGMERVLFSEIERVSRYKGSLCLIALDIDGFRDMNERLGYAACDRVLRELAAALKSRIRITDFLGRWGSDEFMVLTPLPPAAAYPLAETIRDMAAHNRFGEGKGEILTLSAGVAEYLKGMDTTAFVASAYDALTEARRGGGNRVARG
jgi:diguanylate cyclase (GGDEF)-like protein/PAS domain S-box-containing protein